MPQNVAELAERYMAVIENGRIVVAHFWKGRRTGFAILETRPRLTVANASTVAEEMNLASLKDVLAIAPGV